MFWTCRTPPAVRCRVALGAPGADVKLPCTPAPVIMLADDVPAEHIMPPDVAPVALFVDEATPLLDPEALVVSLRLLSAMTSAPRPSATAKRKDQRERTGELKRPPPTFPRGLALIAALATHLIVV